MRRRFLLFVLMGLILFGCQPSFAQQQARWQRDVDRLSQTFGALEQLQVQAYRNQDWCKNIFYRRGKFTSNSRATCNLFSGKPQPFDAQAQQDFETIEQAIATTKVKLYYVLNLKYAGDRTLIGATFSLPSGHEYVYAPAYKVLPESLPNEREYSPINEDWYFIRNDWN